MQTLMSQPEHQKAHAAFCTTAGLSVEDTAISSVLNRAWHFTKKAESILCKDEQASAARLVAAITELSILNADVIHIHASFHAHTNAFEVRVNSAATDYRKPTVMLREHMSLDKAWALEQLKNLEDKLIDLVAAAKDDAIGAC
jgi:hypothetical protein